MPDSNAPVDTTILNRFHPWSGTVPAGFFASFLGNLTRAGYWTFPQHLRDRFARERYDDCSRPSLGENIFDLVVLLEAVADARDSFTMAAAGAGWGRWLVAAALAARQRGALPVRLIGVEAEPTHFQWMLEHFRDNHLDPAEHDLIEAAASGSSGHAWFYVGDPHSWYGQSIVQEEVVGDGTEGGEVVHNGHRVRRVRTLDLSELMSGYPRIDYLHLDMQGTELDFLSSDPELLNSRIKRVLVGTHSSDIERGLRQLFSGLAWQAQYDFPLNAQVRIDDELVTLADGVQAWINPAL